MINLEGKTAVITNADNILGTAMARNMAIQGAKVIMTGADENAVNNAAKALQSQKLNIETRLLNLGNETMIEEAAQQICSNNSVDILVINTTDKDENSEKNNNSASDSCFREFTKYMRDRNEGSVVYLQNEGTNSADKITKSAKDLAENGVRVNCVTAGKINTDSEESQSTTQPQGKKLQPWEVAAVVTFVASPAGTAINGQCIPTSPSLN